MNRKHIDASLNISNNGLDCAVTRDGVGSTSGLGIDVDGTPLRQASRSGILYPYSIVEEKYEMGNDINISSQREHGSFFNQQSMSMEKRVLPSTENTVPLCLENELCSIDFVDPLSEMKTFKVKHPKNMLIAHYNINSIRNKFSELKYILDHNFCSIIGISETKIDPSFPSKLFQIDNYRI